MAAIKSFLQKHKIKFFVFEAFAFVAGFCGIAFEYTFSKFSADLLGSSAQQWAVVIGVMLLAMGIGSDHQKNIPNKKLMQRFFLYEMLLSIIGGVGPIALLAVFSAARLYYMAVLLVLVFMVGFFIGTEIPILARLNQHNRQKLQENLAGVFRVEYIGGFVGAMVWAFFIVRFFSNMLQAALFVAAINLLAAGIVMLFFLFGYMEKEAKKSGKKKSEKSGAAGEVGLFNILTKREILFSLLAFLLVATTLFFSFMLLPKAEMFYEQRLFRDKIVASHSTPYQHIVATESHANFFNLYINGQLQLSSLDEHIYHETLVHPAMLLAPKHEQVLILGGGDGMALREVLKYKDVKKVVLVDIDFVMLALASSLPQLVAMNKGSLQAAVVRLAKASSYAMGAQQLTFWPNLSTLPVNRGDGDMQKVEVRALDAASYLQNLSPSDKFDVVIIDFPDPDSLEVSKLYALSFYASLKSHITSQAVVVQQGTSSFLTRETFLIVGNTMRRAGFLAIPMRVGIPSFGEWGFWLGFAGTSELYSKLQQKAVESTTTTWQIMGSGGESEKQKLRRAAAFLTVENFLYWRKTGVLKNGLRYISQETLPGLFAFPPSALRSSVHNKNNILKNIEKFNNGADFPKGEYNTVINQHIYKTYLYENVKY